MAGWIRTEQDIEGTHARGVLSATRSILTRVNPDDWEDRRYRQVREDDGVILREVYMDIGTFQDLGEPEVITLTIEPGDTLNP